MAASRLPCRKISRDMVEHQPEPLAHHLTAAGDNERAIDQWLKAGQLAASRSANLEAIAHLQRGIQAIRAFADGTNDLTELKLLYTLGPCVIATQGPISDMARETFARACYSCRCARCRRSGSRTHVLGTVGGRLFRCGRSPHKPQP